MKRLLLPTLVFAALWVIALVSQDHGQARVDDTVPTFTNQVVRIFQANCQTCHHPGDIGPFSLTNYEEASIWASSIKQAVTSREMPPWKPLEGCNEFEGSRRLSDEDIDTLVRWVDGGAPEGNLADMPPALSFPDEWKMGQPDSIVVTAKKPYKFVPIDGEDEYRCFTIPAGFDSDRYITGMEVRPGNREVVHHVLVYVDKDNISAALDAADPGPGYRSSGGGIGFTPTGSLGGWAPGAGGSIAPPNAGVRVPKGSRIVIQVHYSALHAHHGSEHSDQTKVGLHFAREPIRKNYYVLPLLNTTFTIPAGEASHEVKAAITLPPGVNLTLHQIAPHMHLLGREMNVIATTPSGQQTCLIDINDWDFHWQGAYRYSTPIPLPSGTRIDLSAHYDNSVNNPRNPSSPPRNVSWGEGTKDEMCIAFLGITIDAELMSVSSPSITAARVDGSKLVVTGTGVAKGSLIEVNGRVVVDSKGKKTNVTSAQGWQAEIPVGSTVSLTVLNPNGARSAAYSFTR